MASRRNRIVVKPNLKPAAPKSVAASTTQKAKSSTLINTPSAPLETASVGGKTTVPPTPPEKVAVPVAAEAEKKKSGVEKRAVDFQGSDDVEGGGDGVTSEVGAIKQKLNAHLLKKSVVSNLVDEFAQDSDKPDQSTDGFALDVSVDFRTEESQNKNVVDKVAETDAPNAVREAVTKSIISESSPGLPTSQKDCDKDTSSSVTRNSRKPDPITSGDVDDNDENNDDADNSVIDETEVQALSAKSKELITVDGQEVVVDGDDPPQPKPRRRKREKKERKEPLPPSDKSPDRHKMKMSDLIIWNPAQNYFPKKKKTASNTVKKEERPKTPESVLSVEDDDEASNQSNSLPAPRVMIGPDGNIILDTQSLIIEAPKEDTDAKTIIEEDDDDRYLNSNSYRKTSKTKLWTDKENEKFFMGLSMCGTDFSLMCNLLPKRSRRELKNKFRREERRNRFLIDKALSSRQPYDLTPFERMAEEEAAKTKADIEIKKEAKKRVKEEKQRTKREIKKEKERAKKRKTPVSEDEEDDWGEEPDYDDEYDENTEIVDADTVNVSNAKKRKVVMGDKLAVDADVVVEANNNNNDDDEIDIDKTPTPHRGHLAFTPLEENHNNSIYQTSSDLDQQQQLQTGAIPTQPLQAQQQAQINSPVLGQPLSSTGGSSGLQSNPSVIATPNTSNNNNNNIAARPSTTGSTPAALASIPGSAPIQIEMEGVTNPMQGVLIPSHMVPQLAPQLGIPHYSTPMQVLLVQEEGGAGNMVHVYVLPDKDSNALIPQAGQGRVAPDGSGHGLTLTSPIPSPHPPPRRPSTSSTPTMNPSSPFSPSAAQHNMQQVPFKSPSQAPSTSGHGSDSETSLSTIRNVYGTAMNSLTSGTRERRDSSSSHSLTTLNGSSSPQTQTHSRSHTHLLPSSSPIIATNPTHNRPHAINTQNISNTYSVAHSTSTNPNLNVTQNLGMNFQSSSMSSSPLSSGAVTNQMTVLSSHQPPPPFTHSNQLVNVSNAHPPPPVSGVHRSVDIQSSDSINNVNNNVTEPQQIPSGSMDGNMNILNTSTNIPSLPGTSHCSSLIPDSPLNSNLSNERFHTKSPQQQ